MIEIPIDLVTVSAVLIGEDLHTVEPGTFTIGSAVFTMLDEDGRPVTCYGGNMHPASYSFTTTNGTRYVGPYSAVKKIQHDTQPPEPEEPKHVLLGVGTRVLVSDPHDRNCDCGNEQPYVGKIAGYDMFRSKYQINEEVYGRPGEYYGHVRWVFVDNRVQVHPDGPEYVPTPAPEPVKQEPTGPRIYVRNHHGKQGYVLGTRRTAEDVVQMLVQWFAPGASPVWKDQGILTIIPEDEVDRCPNGQTADECGSGENQCELCLADEDEEGDEIERSMGLR